MNKTQKIWLTIGIMATFGLLALLLFSYQFKMVVCGYSGAKCWIAYNLVSIYFFLGPAILFSVLTTFRANTEIVRKWNKVTSIFVAIFLVWISFMPWMVGDAIFGFTKATFALVLVFLYSMFSIGYVQYLKTKIR